ncbi:MAG: hypothetical protein HUU55_01755 [Myxococcales bacterium]|nr:hypothetical protein [Myxococcales bacterium]
MAAEESAQTTKSGSLQITPGQEVRPEFLAAIGTTPVAVVPGVGVLDIWTTFATIEPDKPIRGRLCKKRVARDEARRILELGRELGGRWVRGQALKEDVERLEEIACAPNADVLATAEAIAEIPARARAVLFHRCEQALRQTSQPVDLAIAQTLAQQIENSDLKAPDFVLFTLIWLLTLSDDRPNDDSVLHWVLRHEENRDGLTGIISNLDDLFSDVTGRKTSSTIQSRLDRAGALRFRVSMPVLGPQVVVLDPNLTSPPPSVDPVTTRSISNVAPQRSATTEVSRTITTTPSDQQRVVSPRSTPDQAGTKTDGGIIEPVRRGAADDVAIAPAAIGELKRSIEHLRRDVEMLRRDLDNTNERVDYVLKRLKSTPAVHETPEEAPLSFDEFTTAKTKRWVISDRLLLWIAIALLVGAVLVMIIRFVFGNAEPQKDESTQPTDIRAENSAIDVVETISKSEQPTSGIIKQEPPPALPRSADVVVPPEPQLELPGEDPSVDSEVAEVPEVNPEPETEGTQPVLEPAVAEPAVVTNEDTAEQYGVGTQATHRLSRSSKIFTFGQKLPMRVEELPGLEALIGECILTVADRSDYPRRIYPGYQPIRLSCAGSTKKVCEILGCEPQNSCVTAASMIKPCN